MKTRMEVVIWIIESLKIEIAIIHQAIRWLISTHDLAIVVSLPVRSPAGLIPTTVPPDSRSSATVAGLYHS